MYKLVVCDIFHLPLLSTDLEVEIRKSVRLPSLLHSVSLHGLHPFCLLSDYHLLCQKRVTVLETLLLCFFLGNSNQNP